RQESLVYCATHVSIFSSPWRYRTRPFLWERRNSFRRARQKLCLPPRVESAIPAAEAPFPENAWSPATQNTPQRPSQKSPTPLVNSRKPNLRRRNRIPYHQI